MNDSCCRSAPQKSTRCQNGTSEKLSPDERSKIPKWHLEKRIPILGITELSLDEIVESRKSIMDYLLSTDTTVTRYIYV